MNKWFGKYNESSSWLWYSSSHSDSLQLYSNMKNSFLCKSSMCPECPVMMQNIPGCLIHETLSICYLFGKNEWVTLLFCLILCWASPEVSLTGLKDSLTSGRGPFTGRHHGFVGGDKTPLSWSWQPAPGRCPFSAAPPPDKRRIPCFVPWVSTSWVGHWGEERKKEKS